MSRTRNFLLSKEEIVEPGPKIDDSDAQPVDVDSAACINDELCIEHQGLRETMAEAKVFRDIAEQFPPQTILSVSEEKFLNSFVDLAVAGTGVSVEQLKVFKETPEGKTLSLEALHTGVWETIKKIITAIIEKVKKFVLWITGNGNRVEKTQKRMMDFLNSQEGKTAAEQQEIENLKKRVAGLKASAEDNSGVEVSLEDFEFTPGQAHSGVHYITGARLSQLSDTAPQGGIVFVDNIIRDLHNSLNVARDLVLAMKALNTGDAANAHTTQEARITFMSQTLSKALGHVSFKEVDGRKQVHIVGDTYMTYDERNFQIALVSHDHGIDMAKKYVIAIRSPTEVAKSYSDYVSEFRDTLGAEQGTLKQISESMNNQLNFLREDTEQRMEQAEAQGASHEKRQMLSIYMHVITGIFAALTRITTAASSMEGSVFTWVPGHAFGRANA
jgi:hypothetical protein